MTLRWQSWEWGFIFVLIAASATAAPISADSQAAGASTSEQGATTSVTEPSGNTARIRIDRFDVTGNTLLASELIDRLLAPYLGEGKTYTDIQRALEALEGAYRGAGYSAVSVVTPEQDVTAGVVTLEVAEAIIGNVIIQDNNVYDEENIRNAVPSLIEGTTPSARKVSENLRLANENPTRQIEVTLAVSEEEGKVDAKMKVTDESPQKVTVTMDNTGNKSTGDYKIGMSYAHNNLFNMDQAATLNYSTSPDHQEQVTQVSGSYRLPIYAWGDSMDFIFSYSDTDTGSTPIVGLGTLGIVGKGYVYSAHYNHYFPRQGDYASKLVLGQDYRMYLNNCAFAATGSASTTCGSSILGNITPDLTVHPFSIAYNGTWTKPSYIADFTASVVQNIPGGNRGGDASFTAARKSANNASIGSKANYTILRANGSIAGPLPKDFQYRVATNAQYTDDAIVAYEQIGLAGSTAVRGFLERQVASDRGYYINAEIYTPELAAKFGLKDSSLRGLVFVDQATGWSRPLQGESEQRVTAASVGWWLRYNYSKNLMAKLDWARVVDGVVARTDGHMRSHLALVWSW